MPNGAILCSDTLNLGRNLGMRDPLKQMTRCKSVDELTDIHNKWSEILSRDRGRALAEKFFTDHGTHLFPLPPLLGDNDIVPITTIQELLEEGAVMHHCVGSYGAMIMSGECYIYRVLRPQRATLQISDTGDMHHISQLKLVHNGEPSDETRTKVRMWLTCALQNPEKD